MVNVASDLFSSSPHQFRNPISLSVPTEDPWNFVMTNFMGLVIYYASIFVKVTKRYELFDDFKWEMIYAMVDVCCKYADRPRSEIIKIIKTVPRNYYSSKVMVKRVNYKKESLEAMTAVVDNAEHFEFLYDQFYDRFLEDHYCLFSGVGSNVSDEQSVLMEILYPTKEFQDFIRENRLGMTRVVLGNYFRQKYKWSCGYFEKVFTNIKIVRESGTERDSRINMTRREKIGVFNKGGIMGDKTSVLPKIKALVIKHPRAADVMAKISRHDDCFASLYKEDDPGCSKCIVRVEHEGREMALRDVCKLLQVEVNKNSPAKAPPASEAAPAETGKPPVVEETAEAGKAAPVTSVKKGKKEKTTKKEVKVAEKKEKAAKPEKVRSEKVKKETLTDLALAALKKKAMTMPELSKAVGAPGTIYSVVNELIAKRQAGKRKDEGVRGTVFFAK